MWKHGLQQSRLSPRPLQETFHICPCPFSAAFPGGQPMFPPPPASTTTISLRGDISSPLASPRRGGRVHRGVEGCLGKALHLPAWRYFFGGLFAGGRAPLVSVRCCISRSRGVRSLQACSTWEMVLASLYSSLFHLLTPVLPLKFIFPSYLSLLPGRDEAAGWGGKAGRHVPMPRLCSSLGWKWSFPSPSPLGLRRERQREPFPGCPMQLLR